MLKVFGQAGSGVFAVTSAVEKEVREHYGVSLIGRTSEITENFMRSRWNGG